MKSKETLWVVAAGFAAGLSGTQVLGAGMVTAVHGINGEDLGFSAELPVDVAVGGECALPRFTFGDIVGGIALDEGAYDIVVSLAADEPCTGDPVITAEGVEIADGVSYSVVAHLTESGEPTASVFVNNTDSDRYRSRVNVFHTAAAPAVDVKLERTFPWWWPARYLAGVSNGESGDVNILQGSWEVSILLADEGGDDDGGSADPVFGPVEVDLEGDTVYLVYAVGTPGNSTFTLLVSELDDAMPASAVIVHGINGENLGVDPALPVDVSLNGECALPGFTYGEIVGPIDLPEGTYDIAISLADEENPCANEPVISAAGVELAGGISYSIVANLDESGQPTASVFQNDLDTVGAWSRVNVFHTAAAPTVDVEFDRAIPRWWRSRFLEGVSNGESGDLLLLRGAWNVSILPAGGDEAVFGPAMLEFDRGNVYLVYAVGSLVNETFDVLIKVIED